MSTRRFGSAQVEIDAAGFLVARDAWTPDIGEAMAREAGVALGPLHWRILNIAREDYAARGEAPSLARIAAAARMSPAAVGALFPHGPAALIRRLAGIPRS